MKQTDFERHLKAAGEAQTHTPKEGSWELLEAQLHPPLQKRTLFSTPTRYWAAAAAVLLLIAVGAFLFYSPPAKQPLAGKKSQTPRANKVGPPNFRDHPAPVVAHSGPPKSSKSRMQKSYGKQTEEQNIPELKAPLPKKDTAALTQIALSPETPPAEDVPRRQPGALPLPAESYAGRRSSKTAFDVSALYGFPGALSTQYRVSVEARRPLSRKFFVQVQLQASRIGVEAQQDYTYQSVSIGGGGPGAAAPPEPTTQQTEAVYTGTLYNVGFSPGIGLQLLKNTSFTVGPDVQKPVSGAVTLRNEEAFRNQITGAPLIEETRAVPSLDFGFQSRLQVGLTPHFSINLLYRQGFTSYGPVHSTRNSFAGMGLSYRFK